MVWRSFCTILFEAYHSSVCYEWVLKRGRVYHVFIVTAFSFFLIQLGYSLMLLGLISNYSMFESHIRFLGIEHPMNFKRLSLTRDSSGTWLRIWIAAKFLSKILLFGKDIFIFKLFDSVILVLLFRCFWLGRCCFVSFLLFVWFCGTLIWYLFNLTCSLSHNKTCLRKQYNSKRQTLIVGCFNWR